MTSIENYYNSFYSELSLIDANENNFDKISDLLPELVGSEEILDLGCGYGSVCGQLVKQGYSVTGVDLNDDALTSLEKGGFHTLKGDISKPLNLEKKYDIVLLLDIMEHVFLPEVVLSQAKDYIQDTGFILMTVPLYFDILDRLKILFTGSIISLDNWGYGKRIYRNFRSYNYDHIRFFRPSDIFEMGKKVGLVPDKIIWEPVVYPNPGILHYLIKIIINKRTVKLNPDLLAHRLKVRWKIAV